MLERYPKLNQEIGTSFCIFLLATASFCYGQKGNNGQTASLPVNDTTAVIERVESIYNEMFACQNKGEGFDGDAYISARLKALWESLPEGELIYSADVWTGVQDFDSLILKGVGVDGQRNSLRRDELRKDTFVVTVRFQTSDKGRTNTAYVKTVYERGGWYIDDITHSFNGKEYSISEIADEQVPDSVVYYLYEAPYGQTAENNVIELRYEDGKPCDGYFWGTSDEFSDAREGFYPGFAVWQMTEIRTTGDTLSFLIDSRGVDYSSIPVSTDIHQMAEAFEKECRPWEQESKFFQDTVRYTCTITPETLTVNRKSKYDNGTRRFIRKSSEERSKQ